MDELGEFCKGRKIGYLLPCLLEMSINSLMAVKKDTDEAGLKPYKSLVSAFISETLKVF